MSPERLPDAVPLDPAGEVPEGVVAYTWDGAPILLLVAPDTGDSVVRAAIALAEARAEAGHATVLADASSRDPRLHSFLDVGNEEGLADVLLYGVSLEHVRHRPPARLFEFIPVGPYLPEGAEALDNDRWTGIAETLAAEGATLLLFVLAGTAGLAGLSRRFGQAVLLGDARSVERGAARLDPGCEVVAVVEPVEAVAPEQLAAMAGTATDAEAETIFDRPGTDEPLLAEVETPRRKVSPVLWVLLVVTLAVAAWFLYSEYFAGSDPGDSVAEVAPDEQAAASAVADSGLAAPDAEPAVRGDPVEQPVPISIAVEAHQDFGAALERARDLREAEPDLTFFLAPVDLDGVVYYRLLAGAVADQEAGSALMARLVAGGHKTANDPWAIRSTPYAFDLGKYDGEATAAARVAALETRRIPAYVMPIEYESGPRGWRVYGGAFESQTEAGTMRAWLAEAGIEAELVTRTGPAGS